MKVAIAVLISVVCAAAIPANAQTSDAAARKKQPPPVFELTPEAFIQLDWRGYPESPVSPGGGRLAFNTFEVRRVRAGVDGRWRGLRFELKLDPQDFDSTLVKDAYAEIRPGTFEIRFGQFKSRVVATTTRRRVTLTFSNGALSANRWPRIGIWASPFTAPSARAWTTTSVCSLVITTARPVGRESPPPAAWSGSLRGTWSSRCTEAKAN